MLSQTSKPTAEERKILSPCKNSQISMKLTCGGHICSQRGVIFVRLLSDVVQHRLSGKVTNWRRRTTKKISDKKTKPTRKTKQRQKDSRTNVKTLSAVSRKNAIFCPTKTISVRTRRERERESKSYDCPLVCLREDDKLVLQTDAHRWPIFMTILCDFFLFCLFFQVLFYDTFLFFSGGFFRQICFI